MKHEIILSVHIAQCCGSGSRIEYFFDPWIRDGRKSASGSGIRDEQPGSGIRDEQPGSYFLELRNHFFAFFGVKILKFFDEDTGSGMETVRIRDGKKSDPGLTSRIRHTDVAEANTTRHFIPRSRKEMLGIILILGFDKI
jgi:hypothetical protein